MVVHVQFSMAQHQALRAHSHHLESWCQHPWSCSSCKLLVSNPLSLVWMMPASFANSISVMPYRWLQEHQFLYSQTRKGIFLSNSSQAGYICTDILCPDTLLIGSFFLKTHFLMGLYFTMESFTGRFLPFTYLFYFSSEKWRVFSLFNGVNSL